MEDHVGTNVEEHTQTTHIVEIIIYKVLNSVSLPQGTISTVFKEKMLLMLNRNSVMKLRFLKKKLAYLHKISEFYFNEAGIQVY
eukprot:snap_masked-scaffold_2-processed-gene-12.57-mRNA-1 protein AED:1.00 eAED:1.00 QI:0/0/0/0/1/1/2/0/83